MQRIAASSSKAHFQVQKPLKIAHFWPKISRKTVHSTSTVFARPKKQYRDPFKVDLEEKLKSGRMTDSNKDGSQWKRFDYEPQPWTAFMPTPKAHDMWPPDYDFPMWERFKHLAHWWPTEIKKYLKEMQWELMESEPLQPLGYCQKHAETTIEHKFDKPETFEKFSVSADQDWDMGYSSAELVPSRQKTAIFRGNLDITVPKDGIVNKAGWVNVKSDKRRKSFGRADNYFHWSNFTHFVLKVRDCSLI